MTDALRVDRSYMAKRNLAILEQLSKGLPLDHIANHFGLSRATIKMIRFNARKFTMADPTYLTAPNALPYSQYHSD